MWIKELVMEKNALESISYRQLGDWGKKLRRQGGEAETHKLVSFREKTEDREVEAQWDRVGEGECSANQGQKEKADA